MSFDKLEEKDILKALESDYMASLIALDAVRRSENTNLNILISDLEDDISIFNGRIAKLFAYIKKTESQNVLMKILKEGDVNSRYLAGWTLGEIGDSKAVPSLIEALQDESALVRLHVAFALGQIGDSSAFSSLRDAAEDQSCWNENYFTLSETEMFAAQYFTREGLQEDVVPIPFYCIKQNAIYALGQIGSQKAIDYLNDLKENTMGKKVLEVLDKIIWEK